MTTSTSKATRTRTLPTYLVGAYAETIAEVLGVSLETARTMKAATAARLSRMTVETMAVAGTIDGDAGFEAELNRRTGR